MNPFLNEWPFLTLWLKFRALDLAVDLLVCLGILAAYGLIRLWRWAFAEIRHHE